VHKTSLLASLPYLIRKDYARMSILGDKFQTIIQIFMTYGMNCMPLQIAPPSFLEFPAIITANIVVGQNSNVEGH